MRRYWDKRDDELVNAINSNALLNITNATDANVYALVHSGRRQPFDVFSCLTVLAFTSIIANVVSLRVVHPPPPPLPVPPTCHI